MSHRANELFVENLYTLVQEHLAEGEHAIAKELMQTAACHGIYFPRPFWRKLDLVEEANPHRNVSQRVTKRE